MKNGVAISDFFRICFINKYSGFWFDIDLDPIELNIPNFSNIHLFDLGYGNISYMFIGGKSNQSLFTNVISKVNENIINNLDKEIKKNSVLEITGPRIIQNLILNAMNIKNKKDGCLVGTIDQKIYLKDHEYEFNYSKLEPKLKN
uniref:Uncharacterized protein n=1 Tax=viral metagenome TaxID=1070528 RepID=A0A6C0AYE7_9ZZZZ|tara:strand:- start:131 stop:565 length:435 start_codon:yes stop_codon:yes gene_type:complete